MTSWESSETVPLLDKPSDTLLDETLTFLDMFDCYHLFLSPRTLVPCSHSQRLPRIRSLSTT
jgi:hypothetical protein